MRPNVKTTRDVINVAALPPTAGMELDYRTELHSFPSRRASTFDTLLTGAAAAIASTLVLRVIGAYTSTALFLVGIAFLCVLAALWMRLGAMAPLFVVFVFVAALLYGRPRDSAVLLLLLTLPTAFLASTLGRIGVPAMFISLVIGPGIWLLSVASITPFFAVLFVGAVVTALFLCEALTRHFALWMNANPYLPRRMRRRWLAVWRPVRRWEAFARLLDSLVHPRTCRHPILAAELAERTRYLIGYLAVIVACLAAVVVYVVGRDPLLRGTFAVAAFIVPLIAYGAINVASDSPAQSVGTALKVMFRGLVNWCTYNIQDTPAPGVFQSPYGNAARRNGLLRLGILILTMVLLPACWYFPIGVPLFGIDSWLQAAADSRETSRTWFPDSAPNADLTDADNKRLDRLPLERQVEVRRRLAALRTRESTIRDTYQSMLTSPERSLLLHLRAPYSFRATALLATILSLCACATVPFLVFAATWWAVSSRVLLHHWRTLQGENGRPGKYHPHPKPSLWLAYVSRLRGSRYATRDDLGRSVVEKDHVLVGFSEHADYPVLVSAAVLAEHAHITGDSGSGKSSLGIAPVVEQLIERGDCSVVILDLKDDMPMFEAARLAVARVNARRNGHAPLPFRWFTNQSGRSTFVFNPLLQRDMQALTPQQRAEVLLGSLGLDYGEGYGTAYYSSAHRHVLKRVLENNPHFQSFRQIDRFFRDGSFAAGAREAGIDKKSREDASHLYTVIESLASFDALNVLDSTTLPPEVLENAIDMGDVVRTPQVLYFGLASALEQSSVREIAKLALHALLVAAVRRGHSQHQTYLFIDEFQQVVSHDLEIVLRQARSQGIAAILANQTLSDLKTGPTDITPTVQANTRFRQIFSASDLRYQDALIEASGEAMYELSARSESHGSAGGKTTWSVSKNEQEKLGTRLLRNDVIETTDHPLRSLVHITRGHGFTQFGGMMFPIQSMYHIAPETYRRRQAARWPVCADHPGTIVTPLDSALLGETGTTSPAPSRPQGPDADLLMELEKTMDEYQGAPIDD